jgi:hypothetical protein
MPVLKVTREEAERGPLLCSFPHGFPSSSLKLGLRTNPQKAQQCVLSAQTDAVKYEGKNFGSETAQSNFSYAIGIFNPKKKKLDLVDVDHLYIMQQELQHVEEAEVTSLPIALCFANSSCISHAGAS